MHEVCACSSKGVVDVEPVYEEVDSDHRQKKDPSDRGLKGARGLVSASGVDVISIGQLAPQVKRFRTKAPSRAAKWLLTGPGSASQEAPSSGLPLNSATSSAACSTVSLPCTHASCRDVDEH